MKKKTRLNPALEKLDELGILYNEKAMNIIKVCDQWYSNKSIDEFHIRKTLNGGTTKIQGIGFAKKLCSDNANLCEVIKINAGEDLKKFDGVLELLRKNNFNTMYRKQLEQMAATGTVGAYLRLDDALLHENGTVSEGTIKINYVNADCIVPITVENEEILECGFIGTDYQNGKKTTTLVIFKKENGLYKANSYYFDEQRELTELATELTLGEVKPFAIMKIAEVNNFDDMDGYGYPKLYNSIFFLKVLDLAMALLYGDLDKGQKLIFINELLAEVQKDADGKPYLTNKQKELFILMGDSFPEDKDIIYEYNPEIRIEQIKNVIQLCLSLLSNSFGYGSRKYILENGEIKTATEYIGEKQDSMQELNKQREESKVYIVGLIKAIIWFSNQFNKTNWDIKEEILIDFDDSFITDRTTEIESWRLDALQFPDIPEFKVNYVMKRLNCTRDEAVKYINQIDVDHEDELED